METIVIDHRPSVSASLYSRLMASEAALPEVFTTAEPPFVITFANSAWERLCGWKIEAAIGRTCGILQGERTCKRTVNQVR
jgi:PAS domain-containing protein